MRVIEGIVRRELGVWICGPSSSRRLQEDRAWLGLEPKQNFDEP
jgi:hypothetical protein